MRKVCAPCIPGTRICGDTLVMRITGLLAVLALCVASAAASPRAIAGAACATVVFESARFTVCRFDSAHMELRLAEHDASGVPLRTLTALKGSLGRDARRVRFAMNAGMYDAAGEPIGLYVEDGAVLRDANRREGDGNFHLKPNGVFSLDADGAIHVETTDAYVARAPSPRWATQSGPMLVIDGDLHPRIREDGPSRFIRNGVGTPGAHTALFVISEDPVSFGRLARLFRDGLHCRDALYLDGTVSSLWEPARRRRDARAALGPMVVVLDGPTS